MLHMYYVLIGKKTLFIQFSFYCLFYSQDIFVRCSWTQYNNNCFYVFSTVSHLATWAKWIPYIHLTGLSTVTLTVFSFTTLHFDTKNWTMKNNTRSGASSRNKVLLLLDGNLSRTQNLDVIDLTLQRGVVIFAFLHITHINCNRLM